jgi:SAM-dependent methyltransferase
VARAGESAIRDRFEQRYTVGQTDATRDVERAVIGGDWGANGYTTMDQADQLGRALGLAPGVSLLDAGAGRGWPGLYLAKQSGCDAVLLDPPLTGLGRAMERAAAEELGDHVAAICGSACDLPLASRSVDAVVHTDVLCCVRAKHAAIRESYRVLRPGGRIAFTVIYVPSGLSPSMRRRGSRDGPLAVATPRPYRDMLVTAGFVAVQESDCTSEFACIELAWFEQMERRRPQYEALMGVEAFNERQESKRIGMRAITDGVLRRSLLTARRPG